MWKSSWEPHYTINLVKNTFGMKLGFHGFGDGLCEFMLGLHTHKKL
jgi:hypothetical protein